MAQNATCPPRVIGCDVGKSTLTVFDTATGELADTAETLLAFARGLPCGLRSYRRLQLLLAAADAGAS